MATAERIDSKAENWFTSPTRASSLTVGEMAFPDSLASLSRTQWISIVLTAISAYLLARSIYNFYFHPLAKYPGPRLAAISDLWIAYHSTAGKWPWALEAVIKKYGNVVRIGPNEVVFLEPQAFLDIHSAKRNLADTFTKTDVVEGLGDDDDGLLWERDPVKHRQAAKKMAHAFSAAAIKAKVPTINQHIDYMIGKMRELGAAPEGVDLRQWIEWLAMDLSADLAYNYEMNQLKRMKNDPFLDMMHSASILTTIIQVTKKYPFIAPISMLFLPWDVTRSLPSLIKDLRRGLADRIAKRGNTRHLDYFEQLLPSDAPEPTTKEKRHMLTVTGQLIVGGFDPTSTLFFMCMFFLIKNPDKMRLLVEEINAKFTSYDEIQPDALVGFHYLNGCLQETLRLNATAVHHSLPRMSPGGVVNGEYIPKGTVCRTSLFAYGRSPRYWHDPLSFRPERWLPAGHARFDAAFANDDHSGHFPFITGPRQCPGREVARIETRLFITKMLWSFEIEPLDGVKKLDYERDFRVYSIWEKPEMRVRLLPVKRD
ncbi:Isotrichodermin C-15 hydroxylase [Achaetomium macrosporum]|uniref:Isotrichodermin C-15 hydroxylase n=1 Tax=Achaetomium macrosporum TaxID=79813 RepID=A0AAN7C4A2_9PEZI|nr:Isotrichodermin C-15 hydroxylase [Achaetomium macrosporum]